MSPQGILLNFVQKLNSFSLFLSQIYFWLQEQYTKLKFLALSIAKITSFSHYLKLVNQNGIFMLKDLSKGTWSLLTASMPPSATDLPFSSVVTVVRYERSDEGNNGGGRGAHSGWESDVAVAVSLALFGRRRWEGGPPPPRSPFLDHPHPFGPYLPIIREITFSI